MVYLRNTDFIAGSLALSEVGLEICLQVLSDSSYPYMKYHYLNDTCSFHYHINLNQAKNSNEYHSYYVHGNI